MLKSNLLLIEWMQFVLLLRSQNSIDFIRVRPFKFLNNIYYLTINWIILLNNANDYYSSLKEISDQIKVKLHFNSLIKIFIIVSKVFTNFIWYFHLFSFIGLPIFFFYYINLYSSFGTFPRRKVYHENSSMVF
jgi:hypothetical protein